MTDKLKELQITLSGRVQGVNLRRRLASFARKLGLKGYVMNKRDGTVDIVAQGDSENLEELLLWCQKATFPAKVKGMSHMWEAPEKEYKNFRVKKQRSFIPDQFQSFKNLGKETLGLRKPTNVPRHIAIIPDGNRRWARERGLLPWKGHIEAIRSDKTFDMLRKCKELGIKYISLWGFSTENWKRDPKEVEMIFQAFRNFMKKFEDTIDKEKIRLRHYGRKDRLPKDLLDKIEELEAKTRRYKKLNLQLCLDYGGKDELARAFNKMIEHKVEKVDEEKIAEFLDSNGVPDPDLIIRTSGEKRLSGLMSYQCSYAELYFTNVKFPDFDAEDLHMAVLEYSERTRRFGGTADKDLKVGLKN